MTKKLPLLLAFFALPGFTGLCAFADTTPITPALPQIPDHQFNITDFGAVGDGKTLNTAAFNKAFAAIDKAGGGTLTIPPGKFLTLPLNLVSHLNLHLEAGATLQFPEDLAAYEAMDDLAARPDSLVKMDGGNASLLYADHLTDLAFTGAGTIDGGGVNWWKKVARRPSTTATSQSAAGAPPVPEEDTNRAPTPSAKPLPVTGKVKGRPKMFILHDCDRIHLDGLTLKDSPMWFFTPVNSRDITIENTTVTAPRSPNTDALDPTACTNVLIRNCTLDEGDDNIAVKAIGGPCSNIFIDNVHCKKGHGISIGSETYGGVHDVTVQNCTFDGGDNGIRIKSARDRGNTLTNFSFSNITMTNMKNAIVIDMYYSGGKTRTEKPVTATTPHLSNVTISNVTVNNSANAGKIDGLPEAPATNITLTNVSIQADKPMIVADVKNCTFNHVIFNIKDNAPLQQTNADLTINP